MKAIRLHDYGASGDLKYEDAPIPLIKDHEVLVKVYATSVNHLDIKKASGAMKDKLPLDFPWIPGHDFAGTIENPGLNDHLFKEGDKVYGNCNGGSYAEYLAVDISMVAKKPEMLGFTEAASVPHVAETAWQAIHTHGKLKKGQKVLIHGAAGAVGAYAVQFARQVGATIYGTASLQDKGCLENLGADVFIDYQTTDFTTVAKDMDLVVVLVGGDVQKRSYQILKEGGRLVSTVGPILKEEADRHKVTGISMVIRQSARDLEKISNSFYTKKLQTDVSIVYTLESAADGWKIISGEDPSLPSITHGKVVLEVIKDHDI